MKKKPGTLKRILVCKYCNAGGYPNENGGCKKCGGSQMLVALEPHEKIWFGKYEDKMLMEIPTDYLIWLYQNVHRLDCRIKFYIKSVIL